MGRKVLPELLSSLGFLAALVAPLVVLSLLLKACMHAPMGWLWFGLVSAFAAFLPVALYRVFGTLAPPFASFAQRRLSEVVSAQLGRMLGRRVALRGLWPISLPLPFEPVVGTGPTMSSVVIVALLLLLWRSILGRTLLSPGFSIPSLAFPLPADERGRGSPARPEGPISQGSHRGRAGGGIPLRPSEGGHVEASGGHASGVPLGRRCDFRGGPRFLGR